MIATICPSKQANEVGVSAGTALSRIALRMKTHIADDQIFSGTDPVSIIRFLEEFKEACDHNGLSEGAALHLF
jgi:hypothetical protein